MPKRDQYVAESGKVLRGDDTIADKAQAIDDISTIKTKLTAIENKLNALTDGSQQVRINGSLPIIWGATLDDRPAASSVEVGQIFAIANAAMDMWISNGISWEAVE